MKIVKEMAKKALKLVGMTMIMLAMLQVGSVEVKADEEPNYLTFEALEDNSEVGICIYNKGENDAYVKYQIFDGSSWGETWTDEKVNEPENLDDIQRIELRKGEKIRFKGKNADVYFGGTHGNEGEGVNGEMLDGYIKGSVKVSGDITSLTNEKGNLEYLDSGVPWYNEIFKGCEIVNAEELVLPLTTLSDSCYSQMFVGCRKLTSAPELPAETLAASCYNGMFKWCESLEKAPELPATTLAESCYSEMFKDCTSLVDAPELPATTLAKSCYSQMFLKCESLTSAQEKLPATNLEESCYFNMFKDCTSLTRAPEILATTLADKCCEEMFLNCKELTSAPSKLSAEKLAANCYSSMFSGCENLERAPEILATTLANSCCANMFLGCKKLVTGPSELPAPKLADNCYYGMFSGCESLTKAPKLPATELANSCYDSMFLNCKALTKAPKLPANELKRNCYSNMFEGCTALEKAPNLLNLKMAEIEKSYDGAGNEFPPDCCHRMFYGCTSLKSTSNISVISLAPGCFSEMFKGCKNLEDIQGFSVPSLPLESYCFWGMFSNDEDSNILALRTEKSDEFVIEWKFNAQGCVEDDYSACYDMFYGCDVDWEEGYILEPGKTYYLKKFISNITIEESDNGYVEADKIKAEIGETVKLTVTPDEGYEFDEWDEVCEDLDISDDYTFEMPYGDVTIKAKFKKKDLSITIENDGNGTASANPETAGVGDKVLLTPEAYEGYVFDRWESSDVTITDNEFIMPAKSVTIKVIFKLIEPDKYVIKITNDGHGSASANKYEASEGEEIELTVRGNKNYVFDRWESEDVEISADNTFVMPAKDVNIKAIFKYIELEESKKTVKEEKKETVYVDYDTFKSELPAGTVLTMDIDNFKQFRDMKVHSLDKTVVANQKMIADFYASQMNKRAKILHTYGIYLGSEIPITDAGARKVLAWNMLSVKTPGPIYAACYNQKDGAYLVSGTVNETGTAVFFDFRLYDATNVTLFVLE